MTYYSSYDAMYDDVYCGPKYWTTDVFVDDDDNYVTYDMKRDDMMWVNYIYLLPAGEPEPAPCVRGPVRPVAPTPR